MGIYSTINGGTIPSGFMHYAGGATVLIYDVTKPTLRVVSPATGGAPGHAGGWLDDEVVWVVTEARDRGLGVKKFELSFPGSTQTRTHACAGHRLDRCPNADSYYRSNGARVTGNSFSYNAGLMAEGIHTVTTRAADFADNWSQPQTWQAKVDHSAPELVLDGHLWEHKDSPLGRATYRLRADATDGNAQNPRSGVKSIEVKVDGEREEYVEQPCPTNSCPLSSDGYVLDAQVENPGQHTIEVVATDQVGRTTTRSFAVEVPEFRPPETLIDAGPKGFVPSADARFEFRASDEGSTFRCRFDSGGWETCSSPKSFPDLTDGEHQFEVEATDPVGDVDPSPARRTWTVDTVAPDTTINVSPANPTNDATPMFTFSTSEPGSSFECRIDAGPFVGCGGAGSSYTAAPLGNGPHSFAVRARDRAGNVDASPATSSFTVDTTPPQASIGSGPGTVTIPQASYSFTSSEASSTFQCRLNNDSWAGCSSTKVYSGFSPGDHRFQVRAIDRAGNVGAAMTRDMTFEVVAADNEHHPADSFARSMGDGACQGRVDPVGVLFRGTEGGYKAVDENIRHHSNWDSGGPGTAGGGQGLQVDVEDGTGRISRECRLPDGDRSTGCFPPPCDRYHVRLWRIPASPNQNKKTAGTPHYEVREWRCHTVVHGAPPVCAPEHCLPVHSFTRARRTLRDHFQPQHSVKTVEWSGDVNAIQKCGDRVELDGMVSVTSVGHGH
jgi:hypothetical protein